MFLLLRMNFRLILFILFHVDLIYWNTLMWFSIPLALNSWFLKVLSRFILVDSSKDWNILFSMIWKRFYCNLLFMAFLTTSSSNLGVIYSYLIWPFIVLIFPHWLFIAGLFLSIVSFCILFLLTFATFTWEVSFFLMRNRKWNYFDIDQILF